MRLIRVMCSGRVDLEFVFRAFANGMDGVFIGGCHLNECNYITHGNYHVLSMVYLCKKLMEHIGLNPERLRIDWCDSGEGVRFAKIMNEFGRKVRELGPLGTGEGMDREELKSKLEEVARLVPYIKLVKREKLASRLENEKAYDGLFTTDEVNELFSEVVSYYIDPDKCQACGICLRRCPVEAIAGGKNQIHVIDQEKCIKCGTCLDVCPTRFGAVLKVSGEEIEVPSEPVPVTAEISKAANTATSETE